MLTRIRLLVCPKNLYNDNIITNCNYSIRSAAPENSFNSMSLRCRLEWQHCSFILQYSSSQTEERKLNYFVWFHCHPLPQTYKYCIMALSRALHNAHSDFGNDRLRNGRWNAFNLPSLSGSENRNFTNTILRLPLWLLIRVRRVRYFNFRLISIDLQQLFYAISQEIFN